MFTGLQGAVGSARQPAPHWRLHAIAAEPAEMTRVAFRQPAGRGLGFYKGDDGYLYVDSLRIDDVREQVAESPFYLYSKDRITANYTAYAEVSDSRETVERPSVGRYVAPTAWGSLKRLV